MKRFLSFFLSLAMIFATIILTAIPVCAATNSEHGNKELTVRYEYEDGADKKGYTINVYHKNEKASWVKYNSIVTFEVIAPSKTVIKSKRVTNYLSALSFEKTCAQNNEIKGIIEEIKVIAQYIACDQVIKDMSKDYSTEKIKNYSIWMFNQAINTYVEEYPMENFAIDQLRSVSEVLANPYFKVINKAFYIKDLHDLASDIKEASGVSKDFTTRVMNIISIWGNQANQALGLPHTSHYHSKIVNEIEWDLIPMINQLK